MGWLPSPATFNSDLNNKPRCQQLANSDEGSILLSPPLHQNGMFPMPKGLNILDPLSTIYLYNIALSHLTVLCTDRVSRFAATDSWFLDWKTAYMSGAKRPWNADSTDCDIPNQSSNGGKTSTNRSFAQESQSVLLVNSGAESPWNTTHSVSLPPWIHISANCR